MMKRRSTTARSAVRGFTLVELLVALALAALLIAVVQRVLLHLRRSSARLEATQPKDRSTAAALRLLRQDLENLPVGGAIELHEGRLAFVTLSALQTQRLAARQAVAVEHIWEASADGWRWRRRERALDAPPVPGGILLADGLREVAVEMFDGRQWQSRWPMATPRAARMLRMRFGLRAPEDPAVLISIRPLACRRTDD